MKLIAHRGLTNGPDAKLENRPEQVAAAMNLGFNCEVDLWVVNSEFYLGHDYPDYPIDKKFLDQLGLWIHAKNLGALHWLTDTSHCYFWHENDQFTLTSDKFIWTYPGKELTYRSIMVMPEWADPTLENTKGQQCYGICSNFVEIIKQHHLPLDQN
jgi:hypothetical protein